jgi:hypothetical protein
LPALRASPCLARWAYLAVFWSLSRMRDIETESTAESRMNLAHFCATLQRDGDRCRVDGAFAVAWAFALTGVRAKWFGESRRAGSTPQVRSNRPRS